MRRQMRSLNYESMKCAHRRWLSVLIGMGGLWTSPQAWAGWNDDLAALDAQIQSVTGPMTTHDNAVNVLPGVTTALLEQKRQILVDAGFTWFASATTDGYSYTNFYSFTDTPGETTTALRIDETTSAQTLYRRGYPNEPAQRLGAWWSGSYLSTAATRDELAVLASWGSPLTGIYVIEVPVGTRMVSGKASPMQSGDEYRAGGTTQYWLNTRNNDWLVYALYAPDYYASYVLGGVGAQKLGRNVIDGLEEPLRTRMTSGGRGAESRFWLSTTAGQIDYLPDLGTEVRAHNKGLLLGGDWALSERFLVGLMVGRSLFDQRMTASGVTSDLAGNFGGVYASYRPTGPTWLPWQVSGAVLYGQVKYHNQVPGYLHRGLVQDYSGHMVAASVALDAPFELGCGWRLTPQVQLAGTTLSQDDFNDKLGAAISLERGRACWARVGAELEKALLRQANQRLSLYVRGAAQNEFTGGARVEISGESVEAGHAKPIYRFDAGLRYAWAERLALQLGAARIEGAEQGYQGDATLTVGW